MEENALKYWSESCQGDGMVDNKQIKKIWRAEKMVGLIDSHMYTMLFISG